MFHTEPAQAVADSTEVQLEQASTGVSGGRHKAQSYKGLGFRFLGLGFGVPIRFRFIFPLLSHRIRTSRLQSTARGSFAALRTW